VDELFKKASNMVTKFEKSDSRTVVGTISKVGILKENFQKIKSKIVEESLLENMYGLEPLESLMPIPVFNEDLAVRNILAIGTISQNIALAKKQEAEFLSNQEINLDPVVPHSVDTRLDMQVDMNQVSFKTPKPPKSNLI
jgi:hypothetical protein